MSPDREQGKVTQCGPEMSVTLTDVGPHGYQAVFAGSNRHGFGGGTAALGDTPREAFINLAKKMGWDDAE